MSVIAELEQLQQKRQQCLDAVAKIDDELERVRIALGIVHPPKIAARQPRNRRTGGSRCADDVLSYVPAGGHITLRALAELCGRSVEATRYQTVLLAREGRLFRVTAGRGQRRQLYVARTPDALRLLPSSEEGDGELGQPVSASDPIVGAPMPMSSMAITSSPEDFTASLTRDSFGRSNANGGTC